MALKPGFPPEEGEKEYGRASSTRSPELGTQNSPIYDVAAEKRLVRKLDLNIIPMVMLLYLFSFLDRVNIGNARLYSLEKDLGLSATQYNVIVAVLFITYCLFEVPSNLLLKKLRPSRWIAFITTSWGIIACCTGAVQNYGGMIVLRLLLGVVEAGLYPGMVVYLTFFYKPNELARRVGYLFVSAAIAGGVGGLLAYAIGFLDGKHGLSGWRWIFIIEGLPAIVLGVITWFVFADDPATAWYLNPEERALAKARKDGEQGNTVAAQRLNKKDIVATFLDWRIAVFCAAQFGVDTMLYSFSLMLPTIITGINKEWTTPQVQALTIPVYALGAIAYLVVSYLSDRQRSRGIYIISFAGVSIIGYGILISNSSSSVHYFGCFVVAMGLYISVGLPEAWLPNQLPRVGKRTTAIGLQLTFGNVSGVMAPFLYPKEEGPRYIKGHAVALALIGFAILCYSVLLLYYRAKNKKRKAGREDYKLQGLTDAEARELGEEHPRFVFTT